MKRYMQGFEAYLERILQEDSYDPETLQKEILIQISFMQHERLIHFLVTMLFAILFMLAVCLFLFSPSVGTLLLAILLLALLIPYIAHYYFLENTVQRMYILYNRCAARRDKAAYPNTGVMQ